MDATANDVPSPYKVEGYVNTMYIALFYRKAVKFFLFLHENTFCGYSLEAPSQVAFNEYP